jgi:hypothetical protein
MEVALDHEGRLCMTLQIPKNLWNNSQESKIVAMCSHRPGYGDSERRGMVAGRLSSDNTRNAATDCERVLSDADRTSISP